MATMVGKEKDLVALLDALIELDFDAIEAYDAAIDRIEDQRDKAALRSFRDDHERHTRELQPFVTELGGKPAEKAGLKSILTKGKVVLGSLVGDKAILVAMKANEDDTNVAYDRAVSRDDVPAHMMEVLVRNRDDERRHRAYIEKRLASFYEPEERAPSSKTDMPPISEAPSVR